MRMHAAPNRDKGPRQTKDSMMATARIFQRPKNAMQSGRARTDRWVLEFEPAEAKRPDPLTGWAGSGDTRDQLRLGFPTAEAAIAYAEREGLAFSVIAAPERKLKLQSYADNFR
jgi:hypothetical protein